MWFLSCAFQIQNLFWKPMKTISHVLLWQTNQNLLQGQTHSNQILSFQETCEDLFKSKVVYWNSLPQHWGSSAWYFYQTYKGWYLFQVKVYAFRMVITCHEGVWDYLVIGDKFLSWGSVRLFGHSWQVLPMVLLLIGQVLRQDLTLPSKQWIPTV